MLERRDRRADRRIELPFPKRATVVLVESHDAPVGATAEQQATRSADKPGIAGVLPLTSPHNLLRCHVFRGDDAATGHIPTAKRSAEIRLPPRWRSELLA